MLVERMDEFILASHKERYGEPKSELSIALPSEIINTIAVRKLSVEEIRRIAYICFAYLIQLEMSSVASGFANRILYTPNYSISDWKSPTFCLRNGAIRQYQTIGGRIAFEIFIDLLYIIETGQRLDSKKSKLKAFRKWLCEPNNKFHYFAHVLLVAYRFDREMRSPEVHGTSRFPRQMLLLQMPSFEEANQHFHLINALSGCWRPLLDLLDDRRPHYMQISNEDEEWFNTYMKGNENEIKAKINNMIENLT